MIVATINTDAGFYPYDKVGSFAYYIRCGDYFVSGSGLFKEKCKNSLDAEMKSLINAFTILEKSGCKPELIVVNRDNINATSGRRGTPLQRSLAAIIRKIKKRSIPDHHKNHNSKYVEFRHVKAHSNTETKRNWVNDWCDQQCKKELRAWKAKQINFKQLAK